MPATVEFEVAPSHGPALLEISLAHHPDPVREHALAQDQDPHLSEEAPPVGTVAVGGVALEDEEGLLEVVLTVTVTGPIVQAQIAPALVHRFVGVLMPPQLEEDVLQAIPAEVLAVDVVPQGPDPEATLSAPAGRVPGPTPLALVPAPDPVQCTLRRGTAAAEAELALSVVCVAEVEVLVVMTLGIVVLGRPVLFDILRVPCYCMSLVVPLLNRTADSLRCSETCR